MGDYYLNIVIVVIDTIIPKWIAYASTVETFSLSIDVLCFEPTHLDYSF
jgi:hypothetical protein